MALVEQNMNIKFCVSLEKSATKTYEILNHVYGSNTLLRSQVFELHRRFREGRESCENDGRSGRPQIYRTAENIEKVSVAVPNKRLQTTA
ncbi:protein GVQW3 [Trichonephila clavipes]|nr:protein GVQW3 [Trichonephila clavipes]